MLSVTTAKPAPLTARLPDYTRRPGFRRALLMAVGLAIGWWLVALLFAQATGVTVWSDQRRTFLQAADHLATPYVLVWPYVPWTSLLVLPFGLLPESLAVLLQMALYFALLAAVIYRFEGGFGAVLIVLTSAIAFDTALEINLEWIVALGLLVPREWSGPLLLVKPQAALGYWFGFAPREWLRGGLVVLVVVAASLLLWPGWIAGMADAIRVNTLGEWGSRINIAFSNLLPQPLAWAIGIGLAALALRRRDPVLGVFAWQFFVPYATLYGILPAFALLAARWPRIALAISLALWLLYGRVALPFVLGA